MSERPNVFMGSHQVITLKSSNSILKLVPPLIINSNNPLTNTSLAIYNMQKIIKFIGNIYDVYFWVI